MKSKQITKFILIPLIILVLLGPSVVPFAEAFSFPDRYDLAAILVEQGLYEDTGDFEGLVGKANGPINTTTLKARVDRYATDMQNALPGTRAVIIQVDRFEKPENIAAVLERLYFDGDPKEPTRIAYLKGLVIVGEVPLPVVNKKGNRFVSLFPYTDFEQKAYVWNSRTKDFEVNSENSNPQPEIWHGVIRPPVSTRPSHSEANSDDGKKLLAAYFDKNHLYHIGDPAYTNFDKKVFFQDFWNERKNLNAIAYKNYLNFLNHQDDVAYLRYTKKLLADLSGPMQESLDKDIAEAQKQQAELAKSGISSDSFVPLPPLPDNAPQEVKDAVAGKGKPVDAKQIPDILTKIAKMSDNLMFQFSDVFTKYPNLINDFIKYTGRYYDVDSAVNLITAKDQYTIGYLKASNTMVENKIDELVNSLQKNMVFAQAKIEITDYWKSVAGNIVQLPALEVPPATEKYNPEFSNFSPAYDDYPASVNGYQVNSVTSAAVCTPYLGSQGIGRYSKIVEENRALNAQTAIDQNGKNPTGRTPEEKDADYKCFAGVNGGRCLGYKHFAGCFFDGTYPYEKSAAGERVCFPEHATDPILDPAGTREVANPPVEFVNLRYSPGFDEKNQYVEYLKSIDERIGGLDFGGSEQAKIDYLSKRPLKEKERNPNDIKLFVSKVPGSSFEISMGDVLRGLGWDSAADPNGFHRVLKNLLLGAGQQSTRTVALKNHPDIASVKFNLTRSFEKQVSSVIFHKEPSNKTLSAQAANLISKDLPVDNPRYVTFQNQDGVASRITYPDVFKESSFQKYVDSLREVEKQLNALPRISVNDPPPCSGCLSNLFSLAPEQAKNPGSGDTILVRANTSKTIDAFAWKDMDIDSKHMYLGQYYLDSTKNPYVGKANNGYEMAYFNGGGESDRYEFSVNVDQPEENDPTFKKAEHDKTVAEEKPEPYEKDPNNPFDEAPDTSQQDGANGGQQGYDLISFSPPGSPWFERIKEWADGLVKTTKEVGFGKKQEEFYAEQDKQNKKALEDIQKENADANSLYAGNEVDFSKIASIQLMTASNVVVGGKKADMQIMLKDKNGQPVNDEFAKVSLTLGSGAHLSESGRQITMMSGTEDFGIVTDLLNSDAAPGQIILTASLDGTDKKAELKLTVVPEAKLVLEPVALALVADSQNKLTIDVVAQDSKGNLLDGVNGIVKLAVSDSLKGSIQEKSVQLARGKGKFHLVAGKKSGQLVVNATISSLDSGQLTLTLLPGAPKSISLTSDLPTLPSIPGGKVNITAALYDENGNMVDTNSAIKVNFRLSSATSKFAVLSSAAETVKNGVATVTLSPRQETGNMNIIAESPGLAPGIISIKSVKQFGQADIAKSSPDALTVALLGIPAGDPTQDNYLGGWFAMNGRVQAASSLTAPPKQYAKLFGVNDKGGLEVPDPGRLRSSFLPANNFTMVLRDNQLQTDIAQLTIYLLKDGQFDVTDMNDPHALGDGIYMKKINADSVYAVDRVKGALRVSKSDSEKVEIQTNGYLRIFDTDFSIEPLPGDFLTLQVFDKTTPVAEIFFVQHFNQDVHIQDEISQAPGVYVKPLKIPPQVKLQQTFSGNSTAEGRGVAFVDANEEVKGASAPGFPFQSLEDSLDRFGVGFTEDNKFALLFSAGEMFGEANRPYASDIGIVLGDPTVRINNRQAGTFSADVGKLIYSGDSEVRGLLNLDYNGDGFEDVLAVQEDGKIRLLQNNGGYDQLKDQGFILNIKNGIQDLTKIDFNNDGQMDLAIAAKESCRKGETCVDIYENRRGAFERRNLQFKQTDKIVRLTAEDLNKDGFPDLVFADSSGDIKVLYSRGGQFESNPELIGNVGLKVDPTKNLITSVLVNYPGMATKNPNNPASVQMYQTLSVKEPNPAGALKGFENVEADPPVKYTEKDFIYADLDASAFSRSTKFGVDLNGGVLKSGHRVRYTITLQNDAGSVKQNVAVSDAVSDQLELDRASIACTECAKDEMKIEPLNSDETRQYLFSNIKIPAHSARHIVYEAVYLGQTETADKIKLIFSSTFKDTDPNLQAALQKDQYTDIAVTKEGNPTGLVRYFYTTGINNDATLQWASQLSSPPPPHDINVLDPNEFNKPVDCVLNGVSQGLKTPDDCRKIGGSPQVPEDVKNKFKDFVNKDKDKDGLPDNIDNIQGTLDDVAGSTKALVSKLTCSAGCIPMPMNIALLAPGFYSVLGMPSGYDVGMPVFGWGYPTTPFVAFGQAASFTTTGGRIYISPTLTGGIGFSICTGPFGTPKNCYSFGVNPLDLIAPGICDKIGGAMSEALSKVNDVVSSANEGATVTMGGGGGTTGTQSRRASGSGLGNYSLGSYDSPVSKSRNIRIPGFPGVITDWWARQMEEFTDKILNLPDIYLIYPEASSIIGAFKPTQKFSRTGNLLTNILSWLNSLPIVDIETREVLFKIPSITRQEIEKFKADARQWIEDEKLEVAKFGSLLGCAGKLVGVQGQPGGGNPALPELCNIVTVDMNNAISGITQNMQALDEWILFPKKLLQYRAIESYYAGQIIDYLDTIIQYSGGWIKKNTARVKLWQAAIRDIRNVLKTWKGMIDLMVDYNESCDKCKTERFSLKDLILKLFIAIPQPPVIPLPKLPDFVIDVSRVQAGLRIQWPDVKFKAEPITLPRLPRISLGVNLNVPQFKLALQSILAIPVIPRPPELPALPALPKLNLPKLPDIPPPPKLPGLPGALTTLVSVLKTVVKILCIIRLGITPTDETLLKARIEEITARGLTPVLPIDTLFTIQSPTISATYVDQLKVTAFTNLQLNLDYIQKLAEDVAAKANGFSTGFSKGINQFTQSVSKQIEKFTSPTIDLNAPGPEGRQLNYNQEEALNKQLSQAFGMDVSGLVHAGMRLSQAVRDLENTKKENQRLIAGVPDKIHLVMDTQPYVPSSNVHPIISDEDLVLPFQKRLKEYRDQLALHVEDTSKMISQFGLTQDLEDFSRYIANEKDQFLDTSLKKFLSMEDFDTNFSATNPEPVKIGPLNLENIDWLNDAATNTIASAPLISEDHRLIAQYAKPPEIPTPGLLGGASPNATGAFQNIGLFFIDLQGNSKRLVNYTLEADKPSKLADIDIERDGDTDKIYSYGNSVFLKRNDRILEKEKRPIFRPVDIEFWTIFELLPKGMSANFPKVLSETASETSFTFKGQTMTNLAGFEVIAKNSPFFFENPAAAGARTTLRAHLLPDDQTPSAALDQNFKLQDAKGEILINSAPVQTSQIKIGDYIKTGQDSSVTVLASDSTTLRVYGNTEFALTQGGTFQLNKGSLEIEIPQKGSLLFPAGTLLRAADGTVHIKVFDGSQIEVSKDTSYSLPEFRPVIATVKSVSGKAFFAGQERRFIQPQSGKVHLAPGEILHPLETVKLTWDVSGPSERVLTLSKNLLLTVPAIYASGLDIEISDGSMEVIQKTSSAKSPSPPEPLPVAAGMSLAYGDSIQVATGSLVVHYDSGGDTTVKFNEIYTLNKIQNAANPTLSLNLDPGFSFAKIYAFDNAGNRSNGSEKLLLAPQVCGDNNPPTANFGKANFQVAVGKTLNVDASRSFDTEGKIVDYQLNKNLPQASPLFTIGPYSDVSQKKMRLTVRDEALNEGYQDITVDVITPRIVLEKQSLSSNVISGYVSPAEENVPITIARLRPGTSSLGWEVFKTPAADSGGQYYTDAAGKFQITDSDLRDRLVVRNSDSQIVAEVNTQTGRITITDDRYETRVLPISQPNSPLRIGVFLKTDSGFNNPLMYVYFVPDVNTDTVIDGQNIVYDAKALEKMNGVHLKPSADLDAQGFSFKVLPGFNQETPGATVISKNSQRIALIDVNGSVLVNDNNVTIREKSFDAKMFDLAKQPVVFEMLYNGLVDAPMSHRGSNGLASPPLGLVITEIFIAAHPTDNNKVHIIDALSVGGVKPIPRPKPVQPFKDVDPADPFAKTVLKLFEHGIIAGYPTDVKGELLYKPDNLINRAEFTQITMKMLCIVPRVEAHKLPSPFFDVLDPNVWFYPVLKEGNIRGFIRGYIGESRVEPVTGAKTAPFKPANNITRAEAATVVLAALQEEDIIDLSKADFTVQPGAQWYDPYIRIAQDLKPYLKDSRNVTQAFLITKKEAGAPDQKISRKDFAIMADRVLLIHDCASGASLLGPASNVQPTPAPAEQPQLGPQAAKEKLRNEEGIFVLRPACNACPCGSTLSPGEDLQHGDIIFAAITGGGGLPIYAKSNEEKY